MRSYLAAGLLGASVLGAALPFNTPARADAPPTHASSGLSHSQINLTDVALIDAIDFIRDASGINIIVDWPALEAANVTKQTLINVRVHGVTVRRALTLILNEAGAGGILTFYVKDNVLTITTAAKADTILYTRVYPVGDLLVNVPNYQLSDLSSTLSGISSGGNNNTSNIRPGGGGSGGGSSLGSSSSSSSSGGVFSGGGTNSSNTNTMTNQQQGDALAALIRDTIRPDIWKENGGIATVRFYRNNLIVTAPISVQEAIGGVD